MIGYASPMYFYYDDSVTWTSYYLTLYSNSKALKGRF